MSEPWWDADPRAFPAHERLRLRAEAAQMTSLRAELRFLLTAPRRLWRRLRGGRDA